MEFHQLRHSGELNQVIQEAQGRHFLCPAWLSSNSGLISLMEVIGNNHPIDESLFNRIRSKNISGLSRSSTWGKTIRQGEIFT